jgi:hypothetical protein
LRNFRYKNIVSTTKWFYVRANSSEDGEGVLEKINVGDCGDAL